MEPTISRGLAGVYVSETTIAHIDGEQGQLIYRGYDIRELAEASYEETLYLLWHEDLPTERELADLRAEIVPGFAVRPELVDLFRSMPPTTDPVHALRTAVSLLAAFDDNPDDVSDDNLRRIGRLLVAQFPALVSTFARVRNGQEPVEPDPDLSIAGNFLYMLTGERPSDAATHVMDMALVLHAEHGSNASTFVARSTASSLTDAYSSVTAAIGSLKGPLHGGANEAVMRALEKIGSVEGVEGYVLETLAQPHGRVMGFGHRVYRVLDPRAKILKDVAKKLAEESGDSTWFEMSLEMERVMDREMSKRGRQVRANVDFFSASVYRMLGFPIDMYTPIFAVSRISGWMAHLYEQYADNSLMRPRLVYRGPLDRSFRPLDERG
jgi:citrate synthase